MSNDWKMVELKSVTVKIGSGATPRGGKGAYNEYGVPLIRSQNIYNCLFKEEGIVFLDDLQALKLSNVEILKDDILLNITGDSVARCTKVPDKYVGARVNQHVAIIRANKKELDSDFLKYSIVNYQMQAYLLSLASAGGTRAALTKGMIENLKLKLPDLKKQKTIAKILLSIDEKIENNKRTAEKLEEIAQTLFNHWFVEFNFPDEKGLPYKDNGGEMVESELGLIPKGWEVGTLGDIIELHDSKRVPLSKLEREKRKKIFPYYGAASLMDYVDDYIFEGTYILLGEDGTVITDDEKPVLQYVWGKFWVNNHAHVVSSKNTKLLNYLYILLKNINVRSAITGAVQLKINQANLFKLKIVKSNEGLVVKFAEVIDSKYEFIKSLEDENKKLNNLRDTILPKLMSGKIEV